MRPLSVFADLLNASVKPDRPSVLPLNTESLLALCGSRGDWWRGCISWSTWTSV
jgi:hypothetical protein